MLSTSEDKDGALMDGHTLGEENQGKYMKKEIIQNVSKFQNVSKSQNTSEGIYLEQSHFHEKVVSF